jgi:hypothetical protein
MTAYSNGGSLPGTLINQTGGEGVIPQIWFLSRNRIIYIHIQSQF